MKKKKKYESSLRVMEMFTFNQVSSPTKCQLTRTTVGPQAYSYGRVLGLLGPRRTPGVVLL